MADGIGWWPIGCRWFGSVRRSCPYGLSAWESEASKRMW